MHLPGTRRKLSIVFVNKRKKHVINLIKVYKIFRFSNKWRYTQINTSKWNIFLGSVYTNNVESMEFVDSPSTTHLPLLSLFFDFTENRQTLPFANQAYYGISYTGEIINQVKLYIRRRLRPNGLGLLCRYGIFFVKESIIELYKHGIFRKKYYSNRWNLLKNGSCEGKNR